MRAVRRAPPLSRQLQILSSPIYSQPSTGEDVWQTNRSIKTARFFEITSKRRKGFPSEAQVKRGFRVEHGNKELREKLGRNDPCPCGSGRSFQELLPALRTVRRQPAPSLFPRVNRGMNTNYLNHASSRIGSSPEWSCGWADSSRFESAIG